LMGWVLVSIFIAIILEYFNESNWEDGVSIKFDDIESFQRKWLEFDVNSTSYIRTVDLGLLLYACKPPLVGVKLQHADGYFSTNTTSLARPNLAQLEQVLVELDIPEHDGSVHFLEVLLALLQRVTGIIYEEQIMAKLLTLHPSYVGSIKRMPSITGSTSDTYVRDDIMSHLRRGLIATGLLDELEPAPVPAAKPTGPKAPPARRTSKHATFQDTDEHGGGNESDEHGMGSFIRSFTRKSTPEEKERAARHKQLAHRRASLSRMATSNQLQRDLVDQLRQQHFGGNSLAPSGTSKVHAHDDPLAC